MKTQSILNQEVTLTQQLLDDIKSLGLPDETLRSLLEVYFEVKIDQYDQWMKGIEAESKEMSLLFQLKRGLYNALVRKKMNKNRLLKEIFSAINNIKEIHMLRNQYLTVKWNAGPSASSYEDSIPF
jgi:hypothetical protein